MTTKKQNGFTEALIAYGLSDKEARTYIALLENGESTAQSLAKITGINRATTYFVCETLKQAGFVKMKGGIAKQVFIAEDPDVLTRAAEQKLKSAQDARALMDDAVRGMKSIQKIQAHKPIVTIYEGKAGVINSFRGSLRAKEKVIRVFSSVDSMSKIIADYLPEYVQERARAKLNMRGIHPLHPAIHTLKQLSPKGDEYAFVPEDAYPFEANISVYDNTIGWMSPENGGIVIEIENALMANDMKKIFDLAFEEAKRIGAQAEKLKKSSK